MGPAKRQESNVFTLVTEDEPVNFPAIAQVDAYWEGLRDGRMMPKRGEIDPRGLDGALEYALMLEILAPGVARIRVAGMHLCDLLGMEVRGMPLTALFEPAARIQISDALKKVVSEPRVAEIRLSSPSTLGCPALNARLFLAPLENDNGGPHRIIGCLQTVGSIGRAPRRFAIERMHFRRIVAVADATTRMPEPKKESAAQKQPGFAESAPAFKHEANPEKETKIAPHYLRLVKSG